MPVLELEEFLEHNDVAFDEENLELAHSGILNMHWHIRNGPPYPLSRDAHSAAEKRAAKQAGIEVGQSSGAGSIENVKSGGSGTSTTSSKSESSTPKKTVSKEERERQHQEKVKKAMASGDREQIMKYASDKSVTAQDLENALKKADLMDKTIASMKASEEAKKAVEEAAMKADLNGDKITENEKGLMSSIGTQGQTWGKDKSQSNAQNDQSKQQSQSQNNNQQSNQQKQNQNSNQQSQNSNEKSEAIKTALASGDRKQIAAIASDKSVTSKDLQEAIAKAGYMDTLKVTSRMSTVAQETANKLNTAVNLYNSVSDAYNILATLNNTFNTNGKQMDKLPRVNGNNNQEKKKN